MGRDFYLLVTPLVVLGSLVAVAVLTRDSIWVGFTLMFAGTYSAIHRERLRPYSQNDAPFPRYQFNSWVAATPGTYLAVSVVVALLGAAFVTVRSSQMLGFDLLAAIGERLVDAILEDDP